MGPPIPLSTYYLASFPDRSRTVKCYETPRLANNMRSYPKLIYRENFIDGTDSTCYDRLMI